MPIIFKVSGRSTEVPGTPSSGLTTSLSVRYPFTSDAQDSVTGDSGTVTGGTGTFGSDGYASGGSRYIAMPTSFSEAMFWNTGDGTLSWWQTMTGANSGSRYFLNDREGTTSHVAGELSLGFSGSKFSLIRGGSSSWQLPISVNASSTPSSGKMLRSGNGATQEHIVLVKNSSDNTLKFYINGSLVRTESFSDAFGNNDTNIWRLGNLLSTSSYVYDAKIADLAVWNGRALSADDVSDLYDLGQGGSY